MSPVQESTDSANGGSHKRNRVDAGLSEGHRETDIENILSEMESSQGVHVQALSCSCAPNTMAVDQITTYMDELPAVTQHFDLESLHGLTMEDASGWSGFLLSWRAARGNDIDQNKSVESRPEIVGGSSAPPISGLNLRLRAVVTYKDLLLKAAMGELTADITLELARKLLDYIVLCFVKANLAIVRKQLPEIETWFDWGVKALKRAVPPTTTHGTHDIPIENNDSNPASPGSNLGVVVGQTHQANTPGLFDDIDLLRLDQSSLGSSIEQWQDIAGNKKAKEALLNAVDNSKDFGHLPSDVENILLFGLSGTGKTMMVNSLAVTSGCSIFHATPDSFKRKLPGESETKLRRIFDRAKQCSPSIIFFDDVESLIAARTDSESEGAREIKECLLSLLSDAAVMTVATTSRPDLMDTAFVQLFPKRIYVPLLGVAADILKIIQKQLQKVDHDPYLDTTEGRTQLNLLAAKCMRTDDRVKRWLSGDDIVRAIRQVRKSKVQEYFDAKYFEEHTLRDGQVVLRPCAPKAGAVRRKAEEFDIVEVKRTRLTPVTLSDIATAFSNLRSLVSAKEVQDMDDWNNEYGQ